MSFEHAAILFLKRIFLLNVLDEFTSDFVAAVKSCPQFASNSDFVIAPLYDGILRAGCAPIYSQALAIPALKPVQAES